MRIIIEVEKGMVTAVHATTEPVEVDVLDHDNRVEADDIAELETELRRGTFVQIY